PNIAFGALHARTSLYAFIAGMVGVYMGLVFAATDNVLAPIITHAAYDWAALIITQRAIAARIGS
ncbi:MAG: CPBP family intramembrane metalloprotease, partial [Amphiplicatus sp.]|nr:CPBP family intramembrane metalloprotease [Amphiplicatus sp.]